MNKKDLHPESLMMSFGYESELSEGAVKCPVFQTSTYTFKTAEEGKAYFELAYGLREKKPKEEMGLIYSRLNTPNMEILENRMGLWDKAEDCAVFDSGMAAISTVFLTYLKPGDTLLFNEPLYGGTLHFIQHILPTMGVNVVAFDAWDDPVEMRKFLKESGKGDSLKMVYLETPTNPTNHLTDIEAYVNLAKSFSTEDKKVLVAVDNTYLGPLWQHPLQVGADLVVYSATKFFGGHSDLIAGAVMGGAEWMAQIKEMRVFLGNMPAPWTCWLLLRSLETLKMRMERQVKNAMEVAEFLHDHPKVKTIHYLGFKKDMDSRTKEIYEKQCSAPGSMISFEVHGKEAGAFRFLNHLKLVKLAVSLGSTESLIQHPASMTHAGMDPEEREHLGITEELVRLSVGVEHPDDLIQDLKLALDQVY